MPRSFQSCTSSSNSSSGDDSLLDTTHDSWRASSPVRNVEAPTSPAPASSSTAPVAQSTPKFTFGVTDVQLCDNPICFTKAAPPAAAAPSATTTAPASPSPSWEFPARKAQIAKSRQAKTRPAQGVKVTIPGDPSAQPPKPTVWVCPTCHTRPPTMMRNHNHGIHVPWYSDPSHICWECFQRFGHPAMVEVHLQDTACTYGRGHFSNTVAIWAPLVLTMFQSIAQALSLLNIEALASFVTSTHSEFLPGIDTPDTKDIEVFRCLQEYRRCSRAAQYHYRLPTCIEVLLQWCMLSGLLSLVPLPQRTSIMKVPSPGSVTTTPAGLGSKPKSMAKAVSKVGPKQKQGSTTRSTKAMPKADPKQRQGSATGKPKVIATSSILSLLSIPTQAPSTLACAAAKSSAASVKAQPTVSPPLAASSIQSESATSDLASTILLLGADAHLHVPELIARSKLATLEAAILHMPGSLAAESGPSLPVILLAQPMAPKHYYVTSHGPPHSHWLASHLCNRAVDANDPEVQDSLAHPRGHGPGGGWSRLRARLYLRGLKSPASLTHRDVLSIQPLPPADGCPLPGC